MTDFLKQHGILDADPTDSVGVAATTWVRPADWLALPTVLSTDQKFVGLMAVFNNGSNLVSLMCNGSGGYTVDWGDGTVENYASNIQCYHEYSYSNAALDGTLSTLGYKQSIVTITPQSGVSIYTVNLNKKHNKTNVQAGHFVGWLDIVMSFPSLTTFNPGFGGDGVKNANASMLERVNVLSTGNISDCANMFKLMQSLKSVSFNTQTTSIQQMFSQCYALEEVYINATNATIAVGSFDGCYKLKIATVNTGFCTSITNMFANCLSLKTVYGVKLANSCIMSSVFYGCTSLEKIPGWFDFSKATSLSNAFYGCASLIKVGDITTNATSFTSMFYSCRGLKSVGNITANSVTDMSQCFSICPSLKKIGNISATSCTNMSNMLNACESIEKIESISSSALLINTQNMFNNCYSLKYAPLFNTQGVTSMSSMFYQCKSLKKIEAYNTSSCTNFSNFASICYALETSDIRLSSAATNASSMYYNCESLKYIDVGSSQNVTSFTTAFDLCKSLIEIKPFSMAGITSTAGSNIWSTQPRTIHKFGGYGCRYALNMSNTMLSTDQINAVFTGLGTASGSQAINVTGCHGNNADDTSIATAKGWTVTG